MPPQINCFVQSMTRLQNTMAEMNTILNQMRVIASTVKNDVPRASAEEKPDELDIIGTFDYMSRTDAGLQPEQAFEEDEQDLLYVMDENGAPTDKPINVPYFVNELHRITFQCDNGEKYGRGGEYELKVAARLRNAADLRRRRDDHERHRRGHEEARRRRLVPDRHRRVISFRSDAQILV